MNPTRFHFFLLLALALGLTMSASAAVPKRKAPESDLATAEVRRGVQDLAASLAKVEPTESLAGTGLAQPFNPPGFGLEAAPVTTAVAGPAPKSYGDREILTALAAKVQPKGTLSLGSQSLLIFGKKNLRMGDHLTVSYEGQDYILELVSFDNTNFTLRLNKEEITRPIKPGKNQ